MSRWLGGEFSSSPSRAMETSLTGFPPLAASDLPGTTVMRVDGCRFRAGGEARAREMLHDGGSFAANFPFCRPSSDFPHPSFAGLRVIPQTFLAPSPR